MRKTLYDFCLETNQHNVLLEWDAKRNHPLTPQTVSYGSTQKVWWQCKKGHYWQAAAYTRTGKRTGCPYCVGKKPWLGETDFATVYPYLAAQWHPTQNNGLSSSEVLPSSHRMVWWVCEHGHEWQATVKSRTEGAGCPICANRVVGENNSLAVTHPELVAEWHPQKNGKLTPEQVVHGTTRKVWWMCEHGHDWQASIASRTGGSGCPYCAGRAVIPGENDFASAYPELAAEWHPTKNAPLRPSEVTPYSNRKAWWCCNLGHAYYAAINARTTHRSGCPYCANRKVLVGFNDLATTEPQVAAEWHPTRNGMLTPEMVTAGSHKKVFWECTEGHVWKAVIYSRTASQKCGCPICVAFFRKRRVSKR